MLSTRQVFGAVALALTLASPAAAQGRAAQDRAVTFHARGGGFNALTDLTEAGTADFKGIGYHLGAGTTVQLHRYVSLRGDFTFARNELQQNDVATGTKLNRFFYDAAVQLQYPTASGFTPYAYAGGGAVTLHEVGTSDNTTKPAGTFGLGFNYQIPNSPVGLFAEGKSWLYKMSDVGGALSGVDKTQYELAWSGGLSYRLPF